MGSSSLGAQAVSFGISVGTTWRDSNCQRLKNSRQLVALGYHRAATALMCVDDDVRAAMEQAGTPCPNGPEQVAMVVAPPMAPAPVVVHEAPVAAAPEAPRRSRRRAHRPQDDEK
jgi:hypothetical protein